MTPIRMLNNIESDIDRLLKNRAIMFEWLDKEPKNTQMYQSVNSKIANNTKQISELRIKWRNVRAQYITRH